MESIRPARGFKVHAQFDKGKKNQTNHIDSGNETLPEKVDTFTT